ncbi:MAG: hypothetical protein ACE5FL_03870 [Myxococcota bacterium]
MPRPSSLVRFLLRFAVIYALLLAPWPGRDDAYGDFYRDAMRELLGVRDPGRSVRFRKLDSRETAADPIWKADTGIVIRIQPQGGAAPVLYPQVRSSFYTGYAPTALLLALILATPMTRSRRAVALVIGAVLVHAFVVAMAALPIHSFFYAQQHAASATGWFVSARLWLNRSLVESGTWMGPYYLGPVFIWLLAVLRRDAWPLGARG